MMSTLASFTNYNNVSIVSFNRIITESPESSSGLELAEVF